MPPFYRLVDCWFIRAVDTTLSVSYSSSSLLRPHVVAIAVVAFGRCPTPPCRHCYCQVDCWTNRAADVASSASYSSLSSLWPHFGAHSPSPPCRSSSLGRLPPRHPPPLRGRGREGVGHAAMDNGDGHSLLWHSLCMMQQYNTQGTIWGRATIGPKQKRDCGTNRHKPLQTGTDRHKSAQIGTNQHFFLCRGGGGSLAPFSGPLNIIVD